MDARDTRSAMERHRQRTGSTRVASGNLRGRRAAALTQSSRKAGHYLAGNERQPDIPAWQPLPTARNLLPSGHHGAHLLVRHPPTAPAVVQPDAPPNRRPRMCNLWVAASQDGTGGDGGGLGIEGDSADGGAGRTGGGSAGSNNGDSNSNG